MFRGKQLLHMFRGKPMKKVLLSLFIAGSINASEANLSPYRWSSCATAFGIAYKVDLKTSLLASSGIAVARTLRSENKEQAFAHGVQEVAVASACAVFGHLVRKAAVKKKISEKKALLENEMSLFYSNFEYCRRVHKGERDKNKRIACLAKPTFYTRTLEIKFLEELNDQLNRK